MKRKGVTKGLGLLFILFIVARILLTLNSLHNISKTEQAYKDYDNFFLALYNVFPSAEWGRDGDRESAVELKNQLLDLYGEEYYRYADRATVLEGAVRDIDYYYENGYMTESCYNRFQEDMAPSRLYLIANYTNCHIVGEIADRQYVSQVGNTVKVRFTIQLEFFDMGNTSSITVPAQVLTTHCDMVRVLRDGRWILTDIQMEDILDKWLSTEI